MNSKVQTRMPPPISDINECSEISGLCEGGECQNTFGSFVCTCRPGYRLDQTRKKCKGW